ncbi:hypothetical protein FA13DRAFT_1790474 [Coprinellus micaceus]|uniref:Uncharacterized protein n=1 Tax=Coprinellus micaceus TaxID=71717 RepID=A0A4Y7TH04_COPMI|nr:hypothetical protein FA13DRAFT_1790474 [Coprinellus micaceus]
MNFKTLTLLSSLVITVFAAPSPQTVDSLLINTPVSVVSCGAVTLSWQGGAAPYDLSVFDGTTSTKIKPLATTPSTSFAWDPIDVPAGTSVFFDVRDSAGFIAQSALIRVDAGDDTSCLPASA